MDFFKKVIGNTIKYTVATASILVMGSAVGPSADDWEDYGQDIYDSEEYGNGSDRSNFVVDSALAWGDKAKSLVDKTFDAIK